MVVHWLESYFEQFEDFIESNNNKGIDYCIYLSSIEEEIEIYSEDDWEFIENSNIELLT